MNVKHIAYSGIYLHTPLLKDLHRTDLIRFFVNIINLKPSDFKAIY